MFIFVNLWSVNIFVTKSRVWLSFVNYSSIFPYIFQILEIHKIGMRENKAKDRLKGTVQHKGDTQMSVPLSL